jgi:uncharacterized membrane protein (UPF0127 family)
MRWQRLFVFSFPFWLVATGCNRPAARPASQPMPTNTNFYSDRALPKLPSLKLWLGKHEIDAELAITPRELATGMMYRKDIGENEGMLFRMPFPQRANFYMKNTEVPLSCAYIDPEGVILEIHDLQPHNEKPVPSASDNIAYVLETKQGWFERKQIGVGTVVRTSHGSLAEVFASTRREL